MCIIWVSVYYLSGKWNELGELWTYQNVMVALQRWSKHDLKFINCVRMAGDSKIKCCDTGLHFKKSFSNFDGLLSYLAENEAEHCTKYIKQRSFTDFGKTLNELGFGKFDAESLYILYVC